MLALALLATIGELLSALAIMFRITLLLCVFIPATTFSLYRLTRLRAYTKIQHIWSLLGIGIAAGTFVAMLMLVVQAQSIDPRCSEIGDPHLVECTLTDDPRDEGHYVSKEQARSLLLNDIVQDTTRCVIVPAFAGITLTSVGIWLIKHIRQRPTI